ncbi:MAG: peptide ABC transporter substrate-binding protein [Solobacterium sp.]|nr:peptide ABC transporter substrate-binding protein [Solobacterium sp.]
MKKLVNVLLSGAMVFGLAACGGGGTAATTTSEPAASAEATAAATAEATAEATAAATAEAAPTADAGDSSITVGIAMQFDTLDPALSTTVYNGYVINSIYAGLFKFDDNNLPVPDLCEDYDMSEDGLEWTFYLRKDAVFSDGTPIKAENYVFSILRALSYGAENAFRTSGMVEYIKGANEYRDNAIKVGKDFDCLTEDHSGVGVEAIDDYTLKYTLNHIVPYLDINLVGGGAWSALPLDTPQHDSTWSITPGYATSGLYDLVSFDLNDSAVVQKSDTFYDQSRVTMNEIVWQVMSDPSAQEAAFKKGDIDVALSVSTDGALSYQGTDNLWMLQYPSTYSLVVNSGETGNPALADIRVRKALYMAIDKEAIVNVIGNTDMYPLLEGYVPFGLPGANGDFRTERDAEGYDIVYDKDEAIKLLNEAGYNENNKLQLVYKYSKNSFHEDVATMLQSMWQALGCVDVTFNATEGGVYYDELDQGLVEIGRYGLQTSDSPMTMLKNWTSDNLVTPYMPADAQAEYDAMIKEAWTHADPVEFANALHAAEDWLIQENYYQFPMFQFAQPALVQSNLKNYKLHITTLDFTQCTKE